MTRLRYLALAAIVIACLPGTAHALIMGGEGNDPIRDPGWPTGAAAVFNVTARVAYWEGPPFGGGEWHAECRGDADAFNQMLADFAAIETPKKRLIIHNGAGRSFWLNPDGDEAKAEAAHIDWTFTIWVSENWKRLQGLPPDLRPASDGDQPVPQLDLYTGRIRFADLDIPRGIEVQDCRLEAHGYSVEDGIVIEGEVASLADKRPLQAQIELQSITRPPEGGYAYNTVQTVRTNAVGQWALKSPPQGNHRIVVSAPLHVSRVAEHYSFDDQPRWMQLNVDLARGGRVTGRTVDAEGQPLKGVDVRLGNIDAGTGGRYRTPHDLTTITNAGGRFELIDVPHGTASIHVRLPGYVRPGLGPTVNVPSADHTLTMVKAASIAITVDFGEKPRPKGYMVELKPEGGERVGAWSGSGNVDGEGKLEWDYIPPGRYVLTGRPNPGREVDRTEPLMLELIGGEQTEVTVKAMQAE